MFFGGILLFWLAEGLKVVCEVDRAVVFDFLLEVGGVLVEGLVEVGAELIFPLLQVVELLEGQLLMLLLEVVLEFIHEGVEDADCGLSVRMAIGELEDVGVEACRFNFEFFSEGFDHLSFRDKAEGGRFGRKVGDGEVGNSRAGGVY